MTVWTKLLKMIGLVARSYIWVGGFYDFQSEFQILWKLKYLETLYGTLCTKSHKLPLDASIVTTFEIWIKKNKKQKYVKFQINPTIWAILWNFVQTVLHFGIRSDELFPTKFVQGCFHIWEWLTYQFWSKSVHFPRYCRQKYVFCAEIQ